MQSILLGAHVPWSRTEEFLDQILALDMGPEFAFKGPDLDGIEPQQLDRIARTLRRHHLRPTVHAPFFDLNPGALDPLVRQATGRRLQQALAAAARLDAHLMVVHPGFDRWRYPGLGRAWAEQAAVFFRPLLDQAEAVDCRLVLENIYEETPETLTGLVDTLASPWFGHCFDVGHWHLFGAMGLPEWFAAVGARLLHVHLHDNQGLADDHLPVGAGRIDFALLFKEIAALPHRPSMTLEAHDPEDLRLSLQRVKAFLPQ